MDGLAKKRIFSKVKLSCPPRRKAYLNNIIIRLFSFLIAYPTYQKHVEFLDLGKKWLESLKVSKIKARVWNQPIKFQATDESKLRASNQRLNSFLQRGLWLRKWRRVHHPTDAWVAFCVEFVLFDDAAAASRSCRIRALCRDSTEKQTKTKVRQ